MAKSNSKGSRDEQSLFREMQKLAKNVNRRILNIERLTGITEGFATKNLVDKLSAETLNAITKSGRVSVKKSYSNLQMQAIIKAMKSFQKSSTSTIRGVKSYVKDVSKQAGDTITFGQANVYFQASGHFQWIIDYLPSDLWTVARISVIENWNQETFSDTVAKMLEQEVDEDLQKDLENLYNYTRYVRI